jgi:hypothetical protein
MSIGASIQVNPPPVAANNLLAGPTSGPAAQPVYRTLAAPDLQAQVLVHTSTLVVAPGIKNIQQVMASPPTLAISTTNPIPSGQFYSATNQSTGSLSAPFNTANWTLTRAGNPGIAGATFPLFKFMNFNSIASVTGSNVVGLSVIFSGTVLVMSLRDLNTGILVKVNDQYVSLTPTSTGATGSTTFFSITFGAAVTGVRIDILSSDILGSFSFGGMFTGSLTDTLEPAEIRGPRVIVLGDSITTATGASAQPFGYVGVFAEYMGWDDVWPSGVGGTGMLTATATAYITRLVTDVLPYNPDEVIVAGFYNDNGQTFSAMSAAATQIITTIQAALPLCRITFFGPYTPFGAGSQFGTSSGNGFVATRAALNTAVAQANSPLVKLIDPSQYNLPNAPFSTALTAGVAANATTVVTATPLIPGVHYQFPDGSKFRCLSTAGGSPTATIDSCINAQASGTTVTQTGNCWITGKGHVGATTGVGNADLFIIADDVHPTNLGHLTLGIALATQYVQQLNGKQ